MKKFLLSLFVLCCVDFSFAQYVTVNPAQINFGNVTTGDTVWQSITIKPVAGFDVQIESAYQSDSSFLFDGSLFPAYVVDGDSLVLTIGFHTDQNIQSNSEIGFKMNVFSILQTLSVDLKGTGVYPEVYYASTQNLSEEALKTALTALLNNNTLSLGYNMARDSMYLKCDNQKVNGQGASINTVESVYTGQIAAGFTDRTDLQNNYGFNCEHTFPQSFFNSNEPMKSDMFHLYPTDATSNSTRADLPFGIVTTPTWSVGGSKMGNGVFEPRDAQKGRSARSVLYFLMRFGNMGTFVNTTQESVLRNWDKTFLPDVVEKNRCNDIYGLQHNRNPFIDHPLMVNRISSFISFSSAPVINQYHELTNIERWDHFDNQFINIDTLRYHIIINDGNQDITLSNFQFVDQLNQFQLTDSVNVIHPGETGILKILNPLLSSDQGYLVFNNSARTNGLDTVYLNTIYEGLNEIVAPAIKIFPLPANDEVEVLIDHANANSTIEIFDVLGRMMIKQMAQNGINNISTANIPSGNYIVVCTDKIGKQVASQKLIVQH